MINKLTLKIEIKIKIYNIPVEILKTKHQKGNMRKGKYYILSK